MLLFDRTRILESIEQPTALGTTVTAEGQPVVADYSTGSFGVKPAAAAATDVFYGVAWSQQLTITALPYYETITPVQGGTVNLSRANLYLAGIVVPGFTVITTSPASATDVQVNITNGTLTFYASGVNVTPVTVRYRYQPSTVEINTVQGNNPAGGSAQFTTNSVGVIRHGHVYTTEYDTTIDWATAASGGYVVAVKNALFTAYANAAAAVSDNAVVVPAAIIVNVPAAGFGTAGFGSNAFLGVAY